eukprot:CAMPEP_0167750380 /NCGR_PEP_ID=MMETSP0110_2-20121227/5956_1 /TAXON_ID=629695 /ORGANISM="Gymnochlora sp., Strain CCMP2014" /LENGTH=370 /DNA_ID=CAMNT_0007635689 /DNA_START=67 /DNA_END=1176 /DNA_ORIENTATION=-
MSSIGSSISNTEAKNPLKEAKGDVEWKGEEGNTGHEALLGLKKTTTTERYQEHHQSQHWAFSGLLTVGMVMGTGILALPNALVYLGFVLGSVTSVMFGLLAYYIGLILGRVRNGMYPECHSYAALGHAVSGPRLASYAQAISLIAWYSVLPLYLLTASKSMTNAFDTSLCGYTWALILAVSLTPVFFLRSMKSIEWFITFSDISVIIVVVILLIKLAVEAKGKADHSLWPPEEDFLTAYNPISFFVFAYQGQQVFLEIMSEMKNNKEWPKALTLGQSIMVPAYTVTAILGYYFQGKNVPAFLPDALESGPLNITVNLLIAYHVLCAYLINNIALVRFMKQHFFVLPDEASEMRRTMHHWILCVCVCASAW